MQPRNSFKRGPLEINSDGVGRPRIQDVCWERNQHVLWSVTRSTCRPGLFSATLVPSRIGDIGSIPTTFWVSLHALVFFCCFRWL